MAQMDIPGLCIQGALATSRTYKLLSGGSLSAISSPESLLQMKIAIRMAKKGHIILLEGGAREVLNLSGVEKRGRPARNRNGRFDIVTWSKKGQPRFVVEVKRTTSADGITDDARRMRSFIRRTACKAGFVAVLTWANAEATLEPRWTEMAKRSGCDWVDASRVLYGTEDEDHCLGQVAVFKVV